MKNIGHPLTSWYVATSEIPKFPAFSGVEETDIAIIGAGYTGLGAALELAGQGYDVTLLEAAQVGSGASGRNGGQIHTGQRVDGKKLESQFGEAQARKLWDIAEDAKASLHALITTHKIACDFSPGLIHSWHKPEFADEDKRHVDFLHKRYGYDRLTLLSRGELAEELGTDVYFGGTLDRGGGHLHPLKLALGMARAAKQLGAKIYEFSRVKSYSATSNGHTLKLQDGSQLKAQRLLICGNGYMEGLSEEIDAHIMPINNFILTTEPLDDKAILPNNPAAADSRFVVNYWRKTPDNRLLFGGGENYTPWFPSDIAAFVRNNMLKIYPQLNNVKISHAWGGTLAITLSRSPFVRPLGRNVWVAAGYSGQGVVLAPYFGRLIAKAISGDARDADVLSCLPTPAFFGGRALRWPALVAGLSYYALRDRL